MSCTLQLLLTTACLQVQDWRDTSICPKPLSGVIWLCPTGYSSHSEVCRLLQHTTPGKQHAPNQTFASLAALVSSGNQKTLLLHAGCRIAVQHCILEVHHDDFQDCGKLSASALRAVLGCCPKIPGFHCNTCDSPCTRQMQAQVVPPSLVIPMSTAAAP